MFYDVLWYWVGGTERGVWRAVPVSSKEEMEAKEASIHRMGYATRRGKLSVGAPEGPPQEPHCSECGRTGKGYNGKCWRHAALKDMPHAGPPGGRL